MAYTGAWRNRALFTNEAAALAPGADDSHMHPDAPEHGSRAPSGAPPRMDIAPMFMTESADASYSSALDTPGQILDQEPIQHDAAENVPIPSPQHMRSYGADQRMLQAPRFLRRFDEAYQTPRWEQPALQGDLTTATLRGDNSLPENNPDGYRLGFSVWRRMNRSAFPTAGMWRAHTERWLRPGGAAAATQSPAPEHANRYESPFSWNKFAIGTRLQMPILRRDPPAWSESSTGDGSNQSLNADLDWVVG